MIQDSDYGLLLDGKAIKLHRKYFEEMVKLLGIYVIYRAPKPDKHYTTYSEIDSNYQKPEKIGCIFNEHPDQQTLKKLGWAVELDTDASIISVPYESHDIQKGALFIVPSGIDGAVGRLFRVIELSNIMIYPASITCKIVPEYEDTFSNTQTDYTHSNFTLLREGDQ